MCKRFHEPFEGLHMGWEDFEKKQNFLYGGFLSAFPTQQYDYLGELIQNISTINQAPTKAPISEKLWRRVLASCVLTSPPGKSGQLKFETTLCIRGEPSINLSLFSLYGITLSMNAWWISGPLIAGAKIWAGTICHLAQAEHLKVCMSNKLPGGGAGPRIAFWGARYW